MNERIPCCWGSVHDESGCTCWRSEHDRPQSALRSAGMVRTPEKDAAGEPKERAELCADCAFRPNSPERSGDDGYENSDAGDLDALIGGAVFYCHDGMRRRTGRRHPDGRFEPAPPDDYDPPEDYAGVPYKADGTAADLCAGWCARTRAAGLDPQEELEEARERGRAQGWAARTTLRR